MRSLDSRRICCSVAPAATLARRGSRLHARGMSYRERPDTVTRRVLKGERGRSHPNAQPFDPTVTCRKKTLSHPACSVAPSM
jgi:hypothetical protein